MVNAEFMRLEDGNIRLVMKGHSTLKSCGQSIVCASISTVFYTLIGYLKNTFGAKFKILRLNPGDIDILCDNLGGEAFRMACIGLLQISELFPTEISVINRVWESRLCAVPDFDITGFNFEEEVYE